MKKLFRSLLFVAILCYAHAAIAQGVAINNTGAVADTNAMLDVSSGSKGMLVPRMDSAHRVAMVAPAKGMFVYQTDSLTQGFYSYNGSAWQKVGSNVQPHVMVYTTPGSYTFTTSGNTYTTTLFKITVVGAGGGGGGAGSGYGPVGGGGGGAGANGIYWATGLSPNTIYNVTVGAGGTGGYFFGSGTAGGNSFVALSSGTISCTGGSGGNSNIISGAGGAGGVATGGTLNIGGGPGVAGAGTASNPIGGNGGSCTYGSGGYGISPGASSLYAGSGIGNGSGGGGGGGNSYPNTYGGNGASGIVVIEWSE